MIIVGHDPGVTGGLVAIDDGDAIGWHRIERIGSRIDANGVYGWLSEIDPGIIVSEKVWAQAGDTAQTAWAFGGAEQVVVAVADILDIPVEYVTPQRWQKAIFCGHAAPQRKQRKKDERAFAIRNFPALVDVLALQKNDGIASAACIAEYGNRLHKRNRI